MSIWEDFRTKCPSCCNNKIINWEHCKDFGEKININGEIKCNNPSCSMYLNPKFIMNINFDCGNHNGNHLKPNRNNLWLALGFINIIANSSKDERTKLFKRINEYDD